MIDRLYSYCARLLHSVLEAFIKSESLPSVTEGDTLAKVNLRADCLELPAMSPSAKQIFESLDHDSQASAKQEIFRMYRKIAEYLQNNLHPLTSALAKNLSILNPKTQEQMGVEGNAMAIGAAKELGKFSTSEIDNLSLQWDILTHSTIKIREFERLDDFYHRIITSLKKSEEREFIELIHFIKLSLSLGVSNAATERGFSQTKLLVESRECMSLSTLIGLKVGREEIKTFGHADTVPITSALKASHQSAHHKYRERLERDKKEKSKKDLEVLQNREATQKRRLEEEEKQEYQVHLTMTMLFHWHCQIGKFYIGIACDNVNSYNWHCQFWILK